MAVSDVTLGDLFGRTRRVVAVGRGQALCYTRHSPAECGQATAKRRQALYFFARRPTYIRTRAKMSSRDVAAPSRRTCTHGAVRHGAFTLRGCMYVAVWYAKRGAREAAGSLSRTLNQSDRFRIYGPS